MEPTSTSDGPQMGQADRRHQARMTRGLRRWWLCDEPTRGRTTLDTHQRLGRRFVEDGSHPIPVAGDSYRAVAMGDSHLGRLSHRGSWRLCAVVVSWKDCCWRHTIRGSALEQGASGAPAALERSASGARAERERRCRSGAWVMGSQGLRDSGGNHRGTSGVQRQILLGEVGARSAVGRTSDPAVFRNSTISARFREMA